MPTIDTVVISASGGDYTSLSAAEAGEQGDYVTADKIMEYSHQLAGDTTAVTFSGSTTDATRYIRVFAPSEWRHAGVWDAAKSLMGPNYAISISDNFVRLDGLQIECERTSGFSMAIYASMPSAVTTEIQISNCIIWGKLSGTFAASAVGNGFANRASLTYKIWNTLVIDWVNGTNGMYAFECSGKAYLYNNTMAGCFRGMGAGVLTIAKNNLIRSCTTAASGTFAAGTNYNATDNPSMGYTVTGGGNTHDRVGAFFTFADEAGDNFKLADGDAGAKRYGVDLSGDANLPFSTDITGATRSGTWDIGAHQHVSSAATGAKFVRYAESVSTHNTTATSLKSKCQLVLTASDQSPNTNYFIIAYAEVSNNIAGAKINLDLVNVTDSVTYQDLEPATALSNYGENIGQTLLGVYTSSSTPTEKIIEIKCCAISGTAQIKNAYIVIFKAGSNDFYNESLSKTDCTTSYVTKASITATTASGDYWVLGSCEALHSAGQYPYARIMIDSTLQTSCELLDTPSSSSRNALGLSCRETFTNASHTINYDIRDGGGSVDVYNARIFAIYLGDLPNNYYNEDLSNDTTPATSYEQQVSTTNTFPAVKHLAIATLAARSSNTSSVDITTTMKIGGTIVSECKSRPRNTFGIECTDTTTLFSVFTGSGSSQTVEAGWHFSSSASGNLDDKTLLVIQLQASSGNFNESITVSITSSANNSANINCGSSFSLTNSSAINRVNNLSIAESITLLSSVTNVFLNNLQVIKTSSLGTLLSFGLNELVDLNSEVQYSVIGQVPVVTLVNVNNNLVLTDALSLLPFTNINATSSNILQVTLSDLMTYYNIVATSCAFEVGSILNSNNNINIISNLGLANLSTINQSINILIHTLTSLTSILELTPSSQIAAQEVVNLLKQLNFALTEVVDSGGSFNESIALNIQSITSQLSNITIANLLQLPQELGAIYNSTLNTSELLEMINISSTQVAQNLFSEKSINFQNNAEIQQICTSIYGIIVVEGIIASLNLLNQASVSGLLNNSIATSLASLGGANVNSLTLLSVSNLISQLSSVELPVFIQQIFIRVLELLDKSMVVEIVTPGNGATALDDYLTAIYQ